MAITVKLLTNEDYIILNDIYFRGEFKLKLTEKIVLRNEDEDDVHNYEYVNIYEGDCGKAYYHFIDIQNNYYAEEIIVEWRGGCYYMLYEYGTSGVSYPPSKRL